MSVNISIISPGSPLPTLDATKTYALVEVPASINATELAAAEALVEDVAPMVGQPVQVPALVQAFSDAAAVVGTPEAALIAAGCGLLAPLAIQATTGNHKINVLQGIEAGLGLMTMFNKG